MLIQRIVALCFVLFCFQIGSAQVWTQPAKGIYANVGWSAYTYRNTFNAEGEISPIMFDITDRTVQLFAQYGVTDKLTLQATVPYKMVGKSAYTGASFETMQPQLSFQPGKLNYFGNIELGGIYKIYDEKPMLSVSLITSLNSTDRDYIYGLQTGFNSFSIRPVIGAGWSFPKSWLQYYLGADIRNNNYATAVVSDIEYGFKFEDILYVAVEGYLRNPIQSETDCDCTTNYTAMYNSNLKYFGLALKGGFMIKNIGINAGINTALYAENAPAQLVPSISLQYKGKL